MYICLMASLGSDTLNPWLIMIKVLFWLESFFYPVKILNYAALRCVGSLTSKTGSLLRL